MQPDNFTETLAYLLQQMAKATGAFEATFSNDPELLKYPKIKEFDAVYLNNICGMVYNDPEVRADLLRYVREGGGLGGHHAVTFANNNWAEFAEMMGGWAGAHHTEKQVIKVDDPNSPLTKSFGPASFEHTDRSLANHVRRAEDVAADIGVATAAVEAGEDPDVAFPAAPGRQCSWCDFRPSCPTGQAAAPARETWSFLAEDDAAH